MQHMPCRTGHQSQITTIIIPRLWLQQQGILTIIVLQHHLPLLTLVLPPHPLQVLVEALVEMPYNNHQQHSLVNLRLASLIVQQINHHSSLL
jgi:hypothetical protein